MYFHNHKYGKTGTSPHSVAAALLAVTIAIAVPAHGQQGGFARNLLFCGFEEPEETSAIEYSGFSEDLDIHFVSDRWYATINPEEGIGGNRFLQVVTGGGTTHGDCPCVTLKVPALERGRAYRLTFYMKAPVQSVTAVTVTDSEGEVMVPTERNSSDGNHWSRFTHVFKPVRNTTSCKLTFRFCSPNTTYNLDNIQVERSSIAGVYFSGDMLRVDFGQGTDIAKKAAQAYSKAIAIDPGCLDVEAGGVRVPMLCAELHDDGFLYAWASEDNFDHLARPVTVSFRNPQTEEGRIHYDTGEAVSDFALEEAIPEEPWNRQYIEVLPVMTLPPELVGSEPDEGSFNLTPVHDTYRLTFDRPVLVEGNGSATLKATISDSSCSEDLSLTATEDGNRVLIFRRTTQKVLDGDCRLVVKGLKSRAEGDESTVSVSMTYGEEQEAGPTVYLNTEFAKENAGTVPHGFHAIDGDADKYNGQSTGGSRLMAFTADSDIPVGFYLSPRDGTNGGALYCGDDLSGTTLRLKPGTYTVSFLAAGWEGQRTAVQFSVYPRNREDEPVLSTEYSPTHTADRGQYFTGADLKSYKIGIHREDDYVLKWFISSSLDDRWGRTTIGDVRLTSSMTRAQSYAYLLDQAVASAQQISAVTHRKVAEYKNTELAALDSLIDYYSNWSSTSPKAYDEAVSLLDYASRAVQYRIDAVTEYRSVTTQAKRAINSNSGTAWAETNLYRALSAAISEFGGLNIKESPTDAIAEALDNLKPHYDAFAGRLEDSEELESTLAKASDWIKSNSYLCEMPEYLLLGRLCADASEIDVHSCTDSELADAIDGINGIIAKIEYDKKSADVLVSQVRGLYSLALDLGVNFDSCGIGSDAIERQVKACLTDDQTLADKLRMALCRHICGLLADNSLPSKTDLSDFIGNRHLYTSVRSGLVYESNDPYPDWSFSGDGNIYPGVSWGSIYASEEKPYVDSRIGLDWTAQFTLGQTVRYLPAGIYDLTLGCGTPDARESYIRATQKVDGRTVVQEAVITKGGEQSTWNSQTITLGNLQLYGVPLRLEVYVNSGNSWSSIDEFTLTLLSPLADFDYRSTISEMDMLLPVEGIRDDHTDWNGGNVTWTGADGVASDIPRDGFNLKVTELPDGRRKVEKIILKR